MSDWIERAAHEIVNNAQSDDKLKRPLGTTIAEATEAIKRMYAAHCEAHPPLAELAGAIAAATINVLQHQLGPLSVNAHELVQGITAHLAPLYAENERLKADVARKDALLRDIEHQVGNSTPEPYRSCITKKVRDRIDREIGGSDGTTQH